MKSVVLGLLLCAQISLAQIYRINYQPAVGSVAKHEVVVQVRGKVSDEPNAPDLNAKVRLLATQTFTRVTPQAVEADLSVKLLAYNFPEGEAVPPDFKAWQKGTAAKVKYAPHNPLGFLDQISPPVDKSDMNATGFTPAPPLPNERLEVGQYWDVTKTMFRSLNPAGSPSKAVDVSGIGQAVIQFLGVENGVGQFESYATLPVELITGLLDMSMDVRLTSDIGIHLATSRLKHLNTRSTVTIKMGGMAEEGEKAKMMEMQIELTMRVRALD